MGNGGDVIRDQLRRAKRRMGENCFTKRARNLAMRCSIEEYPAA